MPIAIYASLLCDPQGTSSFMNIVDDLLAKQLVQESYSPYVILALLVPKKDDTSYISCDTQAINKITIK